MSMFDEWTYTVYEPPSPPIQPLNEDNKDGNNSLDKGIASLTLDPPPEMRPRSYTTSTRNTRNVDLPLTYFEWPQQLTQTNLTAETWLQHANPQILEFDERVWRSEVREYLQVQKDAELCLAYATQANNEAKDFSTECKWLLSELSDVVDHELQPLSESIKLQNEINERSIEIEQISNDLQTGFLNLDKVERTLRGPAPKVVPQLESLVQQIDAGITFCQEHLDYVNAPLVLEQWHNARSRTIGIAGAYVHHELRKIASQQQQQQPSTSSGVASAKFRSATQKLHPIIALVRKHAGEGNVWIDLQRNYCDLRTPFVAPDAQKFADKLIPFASFTDEFIDAARTAIVKTRQLCKNEQKLFKQLFGEPTPTFNTWLGDVALPLYAAFRKLLVHETDMSKLCEIAVLVASESTDEHGDIMDSNQSIQGHSVAHSLYTQSHAHSVVQSISSNVTHLTQPPQKLNQHVSIEQKEPGEPSGDPVRDLLEPAAQSRLVFRAHLIIDQLSQFQPAPKDFLCAKFPTVDTALTLLSQIYQLLPPHVFNELAHKCVREVLQSLDLAVANKMASNPSDIKIHLFHIKQLLILQSQISDFDLHNSIIHEVDFSGIQRLLQAAANSKGRSFRDLLALAWESIPRVVDIMVDAMEEVFASLRRAVERMCSAFAASVFSTKISAERMAELRSRIVTKFGELRDAVRQHTSDIEFENFLLDSAQEAIMDKYTTEYRQLSEEDRRNEVVMDIDTMSAWVGGALSHAN